MLSIKLIEANNYANERLERLHKVIELLSEVLNSKAFEAGIKGFMTDGEKTFFYRRTIFGGAVDTRFSNQQVYDIIMKGVEKPGNSGDGSMDLYLTLKNGSNGSVIGFGSSGTKEIFTYSTMFDTMELPELANHYVHEWCHKLGFGHAFQRNRKRKFSVPYGVGDVVEEIVETSLGEHDVVLEGFGNGVSKVLTHDEFALDELDMNIESDILTLELPIIKGWRVAESLKTFLNQVNNLAPNRNKTSDGTIGDARHKSRSSDHNPWVTDPDTNQGIVTALDITHNPGICDCNALAQSLHAAKDRRVKYVIWNGRIMNSLSINGNDPWTWRSYGGENPHDHHIHISVKPEKSSYDSAAKWNIKVR